MTWMLYGAHGERVGGTCRALSDIFKLDLPAISKDSISDLVYLEIEGHGYYVKRYISAGKYLRRIFGPSRVRVEWLNLQRFRRWGIPVPAVAVYGVERRAGFFSRGVLVTEALNRTTDLFTMAQMRHENLSDRRWVDRIMRQVARFTRVMHDRFFAHGDLKWRNILVRDGAEPQVYLIDCPGGAYLPPPFLEARKIKDLACLDKVAKSHLSRSQRLKFYLYYRGRKKLTCRDKRHIRRILDYFDGRE